MGPGCVHRQRLQNDQKTQSAMTDERGMARAVGRNPAAGGRDWVVGDVHGCFRTLRDALLAIDFDDGRDRLFSVGDLIDRGPNSIKAVDWLESGRLSAVVMGNRPTEDWPHDALGLAEQLVEAETTKEAR